MMYFSWHKSLPYLEQLQCHRETGLIPEKHITGARKLLSLLYS